VCLNCLMGHEAELEECLHGWNRDQRKVNVEYGKISDSDYVVRSMDWVSTIIKAAALPVDASWDREISPEENLPAPGGVIQSTFRAKTRTRSDT
jgi:hypothetical protein